MHWPHVHDLTGLRAEEEASYVTVWYGMEHSNRDMGPKLTHLLSATV